MTQEHTTSAERFGVIDGGRVKAPQPLPPVPNAPDLCDDERAADLAILFALGLAQNVPAAQLSDPHALLGLTDRRRIALHDVLCELRNLRWFDADMILPSATAAFSPAQEAESGRRRSVFWNGDGQLTLRTLLRGPIAMRGPWTGFSPLLQADRITKSDPLDVARPAHDASLADWSNWLAPKPFAAAPDLSSLASMARHVASMPAARPFLSAALRAIDTGTAVDPGMAQSTLVGTRLLDLMVEAETQARSIVIRRAGRTDRMSRPAVLAARLTVGLTREGGSKDLTTLTNTLSETTPRLLAWVGRANTVLRGTGRFARSLFLPLTAENETPPHPADLAEHAIVAGALATLLKAVFDTGHVQKAASGSDRLAAQDLDRLAADISMARCVLASHYPAENHQDLRLGETLALTLLRTTLEDDNANASLSLTGFDGQTWDVRAQKRSFGRGHATLLRDGVSEAWPEVDTRRPAHLVAVS